MIQNRRALTSFLSPSRLLRSGFQMMWGEKPQDPPNHAAGVAADKENLPAVALYSDESLTGRPDPCQAPQKLPVGVIDHNEILSWQPDRDGHALIIGAPGTGTTVALGSIITALATHRAKIWVLLGYPVSGLNLDFPHVQALSISIEQQVELIQEAHHQLSTKGQQLLNGEQLNHDPLYLVIDDLNILLENLKKWDASATPTDSRTAQRMFLDLLRKGRGLGIYICADAKRRPSLLPDALDCFGFILTLGQLHPLLSLTLWGDPQYAQALTSPNRGRGLVTTRAHRTPTPIQIFYTPPARGASSAIGRGKSISLTQAEGLISGFHTTATFGSDPLQERPWIEGLRDSKFDPRVAARRFPRTSEQSAHIEDPNEDEPKSPQI